jgi:hypothetical protein
MKREQTHTIGPWRYVTTNGSPTTGQHLIGGGIPGYLAEVRDCGTGDVRKNGYLIAAAPELLAVATEVIAWMSTGEIPPHLEQMAKDAVNKALNG